MSELTRKALGRLIKLQAKQQRIYTLLKWSLRPSCKERRRISARSLRWCARNLILYYSQLGVLAGPIKFFVVQTPAWGQTRWLSSKLSHSSTVNWKPLTSAPVPTPSSKKLSLLE
eukprot:3976940-Amphidinium_carterae.3